MEGEEVGGLDGLRGFGERRGAGGWCLRLTGSLWWLVWLLGLRWVRWWTCRWGVKGEGGLILLNPGWEFVGGI